MKLLSLLAAVTVAVALSCTSKPESDSENDQDSVSIESSGAGEELVLFDGASLSGWHVFNQPGKEVKNWVVQDSALVCLGAAKDAHGGDLVYDGTFKDFDLSWEWKVDKGSNSGVMYHVVEDPKYKAPYETGPEYQIIDDIGFPEKLEDWQKTGADYAMKIAGPEKKLKQVGEWNTSRIVYDNGKVQHWLNGALILSFEVSSEEWKKERNSGKWNDFPDYAISDEGKIALQDHGNKAYFKNIRIKRLVN
ncbi:3-keto-disaccharide hydrolase [Dyadobacter aurulentus]|uniref:3-keto-disaccharide hydrolase n=1 Tax=Dyadobacter sp. UC 10 TaxID=2605428 RepID=UPI0011F143D5|nr:DUF1080 domain-containing protein [Dyadobacter sp. UC 10]KAA0992324.1 DUF1080 domain-containing protein [Dyadobacter sp. UC 10]